MLQTYIIIGTAIMGYILDKNDKSNKFPVYKQKNNKENNEELNEENNEELNEELNEEAVNEQFTNNEEAVNEEAVNEEAVNEKFINIEAINIYKSNIDSRPINDYLINNIVPFGAKFNQDMRAAGVPSSNYDSDKYNLGNNNRTPFNSILSNFTGQDDTYLHKREVPIQFSPLEQRDRSQLPKDDPGNVRHMRDRYTTSILHKNEMAPTEKIQVGPGLNINAKEPTSGQGFNAGLTTEIRPTNVDVYKLNQYPGRIAGTKYQASNLPTSLPCDGVPKQTGGNQLYTYEDRPPVPQISDSKAQTIQSEIILPSNTEKRQNSNVEFGMSVKIK